uniref:Uncharacterized protein n=1 Tax=Anguilla anguilla TaxID=7936 RepID=A0A0E9SUU4_ANGAN
MSINNNKNDHISFQMYVISFTENVINTE